MTLLKRRGPPPLHPQAARAALPEPPAQLLRRVEFKVLKQLDGFLFGDERGLFFGPSLDLAEVREYQPGDEVRRIDWNVTARSGRLHVRQYREERELTLWLLLDTSGSMTFGTRRRLKRDLAGEFAGLAALAVTRRGDQVGALVFGNGAGHPRLVPPRSGRAQALAVLNAMQQAAPPAAGGRAPGLEDALKAAERVLRRRSLVFVVSDFLDAAPAPESAPAAPGQGWSGALGRLSQRHDVVAVRVSDPAERSLPAVGGLPLRDPETGEQLWLDTSDPRVRAAHARLVAARDASLRQALRAARVDLLELDTAGELLAPLLRFAALRRGRRS